MSATRRAGGHRVADDFYETPAEYVRAILPALSPCDAFDPCAGEGSILHTLNETPAWLQFVHSGLELHPRHAKRAGLTTVTAGDSLALEADWGAPRLVITNPPYSRAEAFVRRAIAETAIVNGTVAMLLRLGFLGSTERVELHEQFPADVFVLSPRPSFCVTVTCKSCKWRKVLPRGARRPKVCRTCGSGDLRVSATDASEYAWFVWGPGRGGRWRTLPVKARKEIE